MKITFILLPVCIAFCALASAQDSKPTKSVSASSSSGDVLKETKGIIEKIHRIVQKIEKDTPTDLKPVVTQLTQLDQKIASLQKSSTEIDAKLNHITTTTGITKKAVAHITTTTGITKEGCLGIAFQFQDISIAQSRR